MIKNANDSAQHVDVVIIGAGTAGHNAYRQISKVTNNLVIINEGIWSTTCTTMGCMPSKLLIAAAERAYHANHSDDFGIECKAQINGKKVMQRVRRERDHFVSYPLKNVESWPDETKVYGRAIINKSGLVEAHTVKGDTKYFKADHIIVATGSTPFVPEGWKKKLGKTLITSDSIFELSDLPQSMAVVGAGAIGLELAQAMSRLGVEVTIFNRARRVGGINDEKVNEKAIECFSYQLDLRLETTIEDVECQNDADAQTAIIHYTDAKGQAQTWQGETVLVATGRSNTIDTLGLEHLGVELDEKNRPKNLNIITGKIDTSATDENQSNDTKHPNIYIVGDANARLPVLHVTSNEGYFAGKEVALEITHKVNNANVSEVISESIEEDPECANDPSILTDVTPEKALEPTTAMTVIFSAPQIANVGLSLSHLEDNNIPHVIGEVSFDNQGRSRIMGTNCGLLRIYGCPKTQQVLGASMVGPDAEFIAHILATAITNDITVEGLLASPFYHPTVLEGLRTALRDTLGKIEASNESSNQ